MRNRSSAIFLLLATILATNLIGLCSSSNAFPAQRRTYGFVDRLIRANPLRSLAQYFGRKLSMDLHYPPTPPPQQQLYHAIQPQTVFYVPGASPPVTTHYTKMPAYPPVYYSAMIPPPAYSHQLVQPQVQQHQVPNYVIHGVSYQVPYLPEQQPYQMRQHVQQVVQVQQPVLGSYAPAPVVTQPTSVQQSPSVSYAASPQTGILVNEQHQVQNYVAHPQQQYSPSVQIKVESPQHSSSDDNSLVTLPTIVSSADEINEDSSHSGLLSLPQFPQLSQNVQMQIDGYEDASSSEDMLKIFVIRDKDMKRLKSSSEEERAEFMKGYSMKYIDLEQGAQEMERNTGESGNVQVDSERDSCIQPLCDPFLRKLIPELLSSSENFNRNENDDPIVIVKNNSDTEFSEVNPFLKNHRLEQVSSTEQNEQPLFTVVRATEEEYGNGGAVDSLQGQYSTLKPQQVRVHFPKRKFLSAKMNSTSIRKYEPKTIGKYTQNSLQENRDMDAIDETASSSSSSSGTASLIPRPRKLEVERTYPYYRYGSKKMAKQRPVRGNNIRANNGGAKHDVSTDGSNNLKTAHYTAGVIFNNPKVKN